MTDPIADFLTRIRNAVKAGHKVVDIPGSKMKREMTKILKEKGYILNYKFEQDGVRSNIKIALKYHPETKAPAIRTLTRVSKPGLRRYERRGYASRVKRIRYRDFVNVIRRNV